MHIPPGCHSRYPQSPTNLGIRRTFSEEPLILMKPTGAEPLTPRIDGVVPIGLEVLLSTAKPS